MAAELAAAESGIEVATDRHQRRRRGRGLDLDGWSPWCRRHGAAREDRRRRRRERVATSPPCSTLANEGQRERPLDGHGAHELHGSRRGQADLRPARRPDGDRRRHPRRARTSPRTARECRRDRPDARRPDPRRPRLHRRRPRDAQRHWAARRSSSSTSCTAKSKKLLEKAGVKVARNLVGNYITSLDMAGCSVTLLKADDEILSLWDAPVNTAGLAMGSLGHMTNSTVSLDQLTDWLARFSDARHRAARVPDRARLRDRRRRPRGEHGPRHDRSHGEDRCCMPDAAGTVDELFKSVGMTLVTTVGGASGPLYGTFFLRFGMTSGAGHRARRRRPRHLPARGTRRRRRPRQGRDRRQDHVRRDVAGARCLRRGRRSGVRMPLPRHPPPSRPPKTGRDATEPLVARKGRASYLGERSAGHLDPGATSTALLFEALAAALSAG